MPEIFTYYITEFDFDKKSIPHKHKSGGEGAARAGGGVVNKNILLILYREEKIITYYNECIA